MKKFINCIVIVASALFFAACSGGNSPKGVAEEAVIMKAMSILFTWKKKKVWTLRNRRRPWLV